jgi:hypothetical protein
MRLKLLAVLLLVVWKVSSFAEERRWAEISGGYSFLNGGLLHNASGWDLGVMKTLRWDAARRPWLGIKGEFSAYHQSVPSGNLHDHNLLFGPQVFHEFSHSTVNAYGLAGLSHTGGALGSHNGFGSAWGGSFDFDFSRSVAFRIVQMDYEMARISGVPRNNVRVSAGIVFRLLGYVDFGPRRQPRSPESSPAHIH